jgi:peptidoglycan hydrolase CwlO-like protein
MKDRAEALAKNMVKDQKSSSKLELNKEYQKTMEIVDELESEIQKIEKDIKSVKVEISDVNGEIEDVDA